MASPKAYDSLAGSLTMAGEDAVLQVGDSLKRLHLDVIKNPNDIIRAGKAFDARTSMTLSAWNKKWQAWAGDDLAEAYLRGAAHADAEIELLGLRKGDGTITSGTTLAGKDAAGAIARSVPNSVKASFSSAGLRHHLTFYNTFRNAAFSTLEKTSLQILRSAQDLHRNVAIMAGESMFKEADIFTRRALSQKMLDDYAQRGLTSIVYKNGARVSIDSYAEMVGRTMSAHAATQASLNRYTEYGYDLVRVTAHFQACDLCIPWEGQVLSKSGSHPHYNSLDDAIRNGLFHPNCKHDLNPYFPGVSPDKLDVRVDPEVQKLIDQHGHTAAQRMTYQAEQQQRYIERQIKTWKRREMVSLDSSEQRKAHQKVLDWQSRQRTHINDNPFLRRKYEREAVKGWTQAVKGGKIISPSPPQFSDSELKAISFYKEGEEGWGYQAIRYASAGKLDEYGPIVRLYKRDLDDRAAELKAEYERIYTNFVSAIKKAPDVSSTKELVRFVNSYSIPELGDTVRIEKLSSFTLNPTDVMVSQFGGTDKLVYKIKGGKDFADISQIGFESVVEEEAVLRKAISTKVVQIKREKIHGVWHQVVYLE